MANNDTAITLQVSQPENIFPKENLHKYYGRGFGYGANSVGAE